MLRTEQVERALLTDFNYVSKSGMRNSALPPTQRGKATELIESLRKNFPVVNLDDLQHQLP